ncbi:TIGR04219 family outer membrane beta-barrel protein [Halioxenophilus aromaticivorans]|uniref:TIGR04219 family outer membrane beta-barrel protein n=1 Tax=Halioxenophilus aromaticivorans TaxID=1306992 RepID=A0AAV3U1B8_9ALTE
MTKKLLLAALMMGSSSAFAAPLIDLKIAAGVWQATPSGPLGETSTDVEDLALEEENSTFFSIAFEHPVPVLPNIKLKRTELDYEGDTVLSETFTLDDATFTVNTDVLTDVDLSHTDVTLYWGLPELIIDVDLGLNIRSFSGEASVVSEQANQSETVDLDVTLPMLFADVRIDLPLTGFYVGAEGNALSVGDSSLIDYNARIGYSTDVIPFLADLDFEIGFRSFELELDEDDIQADITIDGPYAQIMLVF